MELRRSSSTSSDLEAYVYFDQFRAFQVLTRPTLFSIYDDDIIRSSGDVDSRIGGIRKRVLRGKRRWKYRRRQGTARKLFNLIVLSLFGIAYNELAFYLYQSTIINKMSPLRFMMFYGLPRWMNYSLEGVSLGFLVPLLDVLLFKKTVTVEYPETETEIGIGTEFDYGWGFMLAIINIIMGIIYGIRKLEWDSAMQSAEAWYLLNIILWLLLDNGSLSILSSWIVLSLMGIVSNCYGGGSPCQWEQLLYFCNFLFVGLLFFGNLGRYLFLTCK
ncbi:hypothetical protein NCAS_0G02140 [Naumovozyma castellii]|uniref:Uncharacterized protein n=1 Tax=Naumovozyma castellii TaxID=27288 RepID=G0VI67_NAUCA|nr:hypothetical protein NCAS_0G02140 [Naumovozyma castellii CBS 4309]CCC71101.1 hypothetical protein NCAS_0G02140 [Naumovozyma castellii CBS 4309]